MDIARLSSIVWIVFLGICFGAFYAFYNKKLLGDIVRAIVSAGAEDKKTAKTLDELGYGSGIRRFFAENALREGSGLRKTVLAVYEEKKPEKKDEDELFVKKSKLPEKQRYYIPEEVRIRAEIRYDDDGTTASTVLITVAVFFVVALISISVLPSVISYFSGLFAEKSDTASYSDGTDTQITEQYNQENSDGE